MKIYLGTASLQPTLWLYCMIVLASLLTIGGICLSFSGFFYLLVNDIKDDCIKMLFLFDTLLSYISSLALIESFMVWACHHRSTLKLLILQLKLQGGFYQKSYCRFLGEHYSNDILHNLHLGPIGFHLYYLSNKWTVNIEDQRSIWSTICLTP